MSAPKLFAHAEDQLHEEAIAATAGLSDFGNKDYLTALSVLMASFDESPNRPESGREYCWGYLVGKLMARLYAAKGWREHPECLKQPIRAPLLITGITRTGTTALHKHLYMDPQFQGLEIWLADAPMPRPPRETWASHPMYQQMEAFLDAFYKALPHFRAIHNMVPDEVEECREAMLQTFVSCSYGMSFHLPGYDKWWWAQDELPVYRYYADVLRLIGANDPGKRWLLKSPLATWSLDAMLEVFPDACIVQTHRDPAKAIPSTCSTLESSKMLGDGKADPIEIGRREMAMWSEAMRRTMAVRARYPAARFLDVYHRDFHADPIGTVERIYKHFDIPMTNVGETRIEKRIEADPERSHGTHNYTLERYGLTREGVYETFRDYMRQYNLD